jgi:diguanylate cyclase (GGDEF)-like protein/PAS domain S-box-containing protein
VQEDGTAGELLFKSGKYDPRTREWYKAAKLVGKPTFSPIYKHFIIDDLAVSAAWPIYNKDGALEGVLGAHITLSNIDDFLKGAVQNRNAWTLIIEKDTEDLIANSLNISNFTISDSGVLKRYKLRDTNNSIILQAYEQYKSTQDSHFLLKNKEGNLFFNFTQYKQEGINWMVITAIPESFFMSRIVDNMKFTIVFVIIAVLVSTVIYFVVTKRLLKPIDALIEVTEKFTSGDLTQRANIVRNDEIGKIANVFNKMAGTIHMLVDHLEATVENRTQQLKSTNEALNESESQLRLILDSTAEAIYGMDKQGNCTFCNLSCIKMLGYNNEQELLGKNMHYQIHHTSKDGMPIPLSKCTICTSVMQGKGLHVDDEVFWRADGTSFDVECYAYPQYNNGEVIGAVVTFLDIAQRKKNDEKIKYLGCHDYLTGLYNRSGFEDFLKKIDTRNNLPISVIFADVNGLKLTNDIFGHTTGDELIKKSAEVLKTFCTEKDIVARIGGDEFIVLLPNTQAQEAQKLIARIKNEISKEKIEAIKCSISLGCATKTSLAEDIERSIENAEDEMYKDKTLFQKRNKAEVLETLIQTLHKKSPKEKQHSFNVSLLCQRIGQEMQLPEADIIKLKKAGFLHDIGKIVLDETILNKADPLTEDEILEVQQHPVIGYRILNLFDETINLAEGVYSHHEKWDASGYPKGIQGEQIPILSRIIAVAEVYDSIVHQTNDIERNTRVALEEIKNLSGIKYDPKIVEIFIKMVEDRKPLSIQ